MNRTVRLEDEVRAWAERHGCLLRVRRASLAVPKVRFHGRVVASSAKLAVDRDYGCSHHAPHWPDVAAVLQRVVAASPALQS